MSEDHPGESVFEGMLFGPDGARVPMQEWVALRREHHRVALDVVEGVEVSTIYIGWDLSFGFGPKLLFETMTFADVEELNLWNRRYPTRELAELGHEQVCEEVRKAVRQRAERE